MGFSEFFQNNKNTILIILTILTIYYFSTIHHSSGIYNDLLSGFWKADGSFLQDAGLSSFLIYFAPPNWQGTRACYLLAERGNELIINEPCSTSITQTWKFGNWSTGFGVKTYTILFKDLDTDDFPSKQTLNFYPKTGKIIMSKNDVIYGMFYKDAYLTDTMYLVDKIKPEKEDIIFEKDEEEE